MARLEIETRDGTQSVPLDRDRLRIGRLSSNDVVLPYPQVSRQHAELRRLNGQWWIADLHSTNGVQLNTRRIHEHALTSGDHIMLAPGISLRFIASRAEAEEAASRPADMSRASPPASRLDRAPRSVQRPGVPDDPQSLRSTAAPVPGQFSRAPEAAAVAAARSFAWLSENGTSSAGRGPAPEDASPSPAVTLLHICQTCGQLTAPDAVYCQNCHNAIAQECSNCRLSLLPIQDRCPRCHTANQHSVRRAHRGRRA